VFDASGNLGKPAGGRNRRRNRQHKQVQPKRLYLDETNFLTGLKQPSYVAFPGSGVVAESDGRASAHPARELERPQQLGRRLVPGVAGATNATASNTDTALFNTYYASNPRRSSIGPHLQFITFDNSGGA